jgi:Flp pilus assembly protein TadD
MAERASSPFDDYAKLGTALARAGRFEAAIAPLSEAIRLRPDDPGPRSDLGAVYAVLRRWDEAIAELTLAVRLAPESPAVWRNLALALFDAGRDTEAVAALRTALRFGGEEAELHLRAGVALGRLNRHAEAVPHFRAALQHAPPPRRPILYGNLSSSLERLGEFAAAREAVEAGLALAPDEPFLRTRLADLLQTDGAIEHAIAEYRRALARDPAFASAHLGLATALLSQGRFAEGWDEYEWRWRAAEFRTVRGEINVPAWDGGPLNGRRLLIRAEQGFGDIIQFARYASVVAERGGRVLLESPPQLAELLRSVRGVERVVVPGVDALPSVDLQVSLLSLPRMLKTTTPQTIAANVPYLAPPAEHADRWRVRLTAESAGLRVGLCYAGRAQDALARRRSIPVAVLDELAPPGGVTFYQLTMPDAAAGEQDPPPLRLVDHTRDLRTFSDTAALIDAMDLVVTIDSAVAHLAGALAKETWLLLAHVSDWRWQQASGERSAWYPTMRLMRQPAAGDWRNVLGRVSAALVQRARQT